ncbi:xylulokinase [Leifsonia poae]|uniref:xylulokinase n=1 Tax=Leifsonia poae TaxID=110933 RepID=UPI001CC12B98|nr:FGGY-family carbohydrate kinase [Leifsonia poae]
MTQQRGLALGIDLGTSGVKVVAVDDRGEVVARARRPSRTERPERDAAEQDPAAWLASCDEALAELARQAPPDSWATIGLSAMLPTLVGLRDDLTVDGPALTWEDGRAEPDGRRIAASIGPAALYRRTGQRFDGRYLLAMHARRVRLGAAADSWVVGAKDYLFHALTGELLTDPSTAAGYGAYDLHGGRWDRNILDAAGVARVPSIATSTAQLPLLAEVANRWGCAPGLPVLLGAADSVLGAYGLGVRAPGSVAYIAGTSNVVLGWSSTPQVDPDGRYLVTPMADGGFGFEMDLMATGSALAWLAELLGIAGGAAELADLAGESPLDDAPLVLPYLSSGEQGALWDPRLVGAVEGLTLRTSRSDLARGLLAGIVLESRRCVDALAEAAGSAGGAISVSGSGAASATFRRDLADATGRAVRYDTAEHDHSALGAALLAGRSALGWADPAAQERPSARVETVEPDALRAGTWADRFARHESARVAQRARLG